MNLRKRTALIAMLLPVAITSASCGATGGGKTVVSPDPPASIPSSWEPALTTTEIGMIQQTFPKFTPEVFAPGVNPSDRAKLTPDNFYPAQFFGAENPQGFHATPQGFLLETNGFDQSVPATLPANGVYIGPTGSDEPYTLGPSTVSPTNIFQLLRRLRPDPNAPSISVDDSQPGITAAQIDSLMLAVQNQLAAIIPAVADVAPSTCHIVIEPTIFTQQTGSATPTYIDGYTSMASATNPNSTIYVAAFYINSAGQSYDWQAPLVRQATVFYLNSAGEPWDLSTLVTAQLQIPRRILPVIGRFGTH